MAAKKTTSSKGRTTTGKRKNTKKQEQELRLKAAAFQEEVFLWGIVAVSLVLFISNFGFGGSVGNALSRFFFGIFGLVAYIFPVALFAGSFFAVSNAGNSYAMRKLAASIAFVFFICFFTELIISKSIVMTPMEAFHYSYENRIGGGIIGGTLAYLMIPAFGMAGAYIIDVIALIITLVLITEKSALKGMKKGGQRVYETAVENSERYQELRELRQEEKAKRRMDKKVTGVSMNTKLESAKKKQLTDEINELHPKAESDFTKTIKESKKIQLKPDDKEAPVPVHTELFPPEPETADTFLNESDEMNELVIHGEFEKPLEKQEEPLEQFAYDEELPVFESDQSLEEGIRSVSSGKPVKPDPEPAKPAIPEETKKVTKEELSDEVAKVEAQAAESEAPLKEYVFPPVHLLKPGDKKKNGNTKEQVRETAIKLQQTLKNFGVNVTVTDVSCGPAVTRYELQPEMGVKVSKIVNLADDIKLNLAAADIRIEAPIPGKAAVGIEVPNKENVMVPFRELVESEEFQNSKSRISFAVGKDISGKVTVTDIAKMPHLLIAGATGSGKSVCINTIIMSILYKAHPDDVKLIMIDPKVVELSVYNGMPHLMIPVVTDPKKAAGALHWAVAEMTERYNRFAEANVREINGYNAKVDSLEVLEGQERPKKMPQIVIIVDELADLMMVASNDVEEAICRLAQLARAAGIHLVIATQRPSVNVITGLIKANMPSRIAFAVTSGVDSRTILDMNGAEKLLGKGDMLFDPQGMPKPIRVQGAFVSDKEVSDVVEFLTSNNGQAEYNHAVQEQVNNMPQTGGNSVSITDNDSGGDGRDTYFMDAARILMDKERASIGMLQRYLKVGFNRAARIMDQLEEAGIVGPEEGTKPRKILMSPEEFEQFIDGN